MILLANLLLILNLHSKDSEKLVHFSAVKKLYNDVFNVGIALGFAPVYGDRQPIPQTAVHLEL